MATRQFLRRPAAAALPSLRASRVRIAARAFAAKSSGKASRAEVIPDRIVNHPYVTGGHAGRYMPGFSFPAPRNLESIIKYALLERETPTKIRTIWEAFHEPRFDSVASVWSAEEFAAIQETKRRCPRFVFPILKGDGKFFNLFAEWQDRFLICTFLEDYRRDPSRAEPYLSIAIYDDFVRTKGLALVRGDFSGHLTKADAAHVLNLLHYFYFKDKRPVEQFNLTPASFDFEAFLRDCPRPPPPRTADAGKVDKHTP